MCQSREGYGCAACDHQGELKVGITHTYEAGIGDEYACGRAAYRVEGQNYEVRQPVEQPEDHRWSHALTRLANCSGCSSCGRMPAAPISSSSAFGLVARKGAASAIGVIFASLPQTMSTRCSRRDQASRASQ